MPLKIKRSVNYAGQSIKFKQLGPGSTKIFSFLVPSVILYSPGYRSFESCTIVDPTGTGRFSVYGGVGNGSGFDLRSGGEMYNTDVSLWDVQVPNPPEESTGRVLSTSVSTPAGDLMIIGGVYLSGENLGLSSGSRSYNIASNTWSEEQPLPGIPESNAIVNYFGNYAATDFDNNTVYHYTKYAGSLGEPTPVDKFHAWNGSSWQDVDNDPPLETTAQEEEAFGGRLSMAVRNNGGNSIVLIHTSSFSETVSQKIVKWTQSQTGPISGSWSYVTGSTSPFPYTPNPMPMGPCCLMWEEDRSRWTAASVIPDLYGGFFDVNIWTSTDDGASWNTHNYDTGAYSTNDWDIIENIPPSMTPDPDRNRFFISGNEVNGYGVWVLNVGLDPANSTLTKVYTSPEPPPAPPPEFTQRYKSAYDLIRLQDATRRLVMYGGTNGTDFYGSGWMWNPSTQTWDTSIPESGGGGPDRGLIDAQGLSVGTKFWVIGGLYYFLNDGSPGGVNSGYQVYDTATQSWLGGWGVNGFTNAPVAWNGQGIFTSPNKLVTTNRATNDVFMFGGWDSDGSSKTWVNRFQMWSSLAGENIEGISPFVLDEPTPIPAPEELPGLFGAADRTYWLSAKNLGSNLSKVMLFTGSWNLPFTQENQQTIWLWEQTVNYYPSGSWTFITGSTGDSVVDMPKASVAIMWDTNFERWTAVSTDPSASPNIWTSTDDGATWSHYTYSNAWSYSPPSIRADGVAEDPDQSSFWLYKYITNFAIYRLQVAADPANSTLTEVYAL